MPEDSAKVRPLAEVAAECAVWRRAGKRVVWTNGCFDLFHAGHARSLAAARALGDVLVVGINSDRSVRELKGDGRPLCSEADRAAVVAAMEAVDRVVVFDGERCDRELAAIQPAVWTKAGDYSPDSLDPAERAAVEAGGGRIVITPLLPGVSTTLLVKKIRRLDPEKIVSAACVFLRDERGRLLMVKTRYADAVKWSLPGGGHHHGESLADTARREMREETGVAVRLIRHMGVIERIEPAWSLHLTLHMFQAEPIAAEDWRRESFAPEAGDGVEEVAWFDRDRLRAEPETVLGRRLWLELADRPDEWPPHILMQPGEE